MTKDQLRDQISQLHAQMDIYDDAGDFRAYARAEMELRTAEDAWAIAARNEEQGDENNSGD